MTTEQLVLLVGVGVLSIGAMCVGLTAAWYSGRRYAGSTASTGDRPLPPASDEAEPSSRPGSDDDPLSPRRWVRERAVRIVALVFLASVVTLVACSNTWDGTEVAIYMLVAAGTLAVVFLQDLLPASVPDGIRNWVEAGAAIGFLTVLTGLSDGLASPFVLGFFLVVGAAALSQDGSAPLVLALIAGMSFGAMGLVVAFQAGIDGSDVALIGFVMVTLLLLAYLGTVAGREQRRAREGALRLARFDPLTGLYNRAHFFASMERELRLAVRAGRGLGLLMLDLDGLKPVNDTFGHHYGDRLLQAVTEVIQRSVRATDTPARYGGDEFVILLPDTDAAGGFVVAEKLRRDIAALSIRVNDRTVRTSVSIGLVAYPDDGANVEGLMAAVDAALYEAKRSGKDRIVGYTTRTERVATRMGTEGREAVTRQPAAVAAADASRRASPAPAPEPGPAAAPAPAPEPRPGPEPRPPNPVRPRRQPRPPNPVRPRRQPRPPNPVRPRRQPRPPNPARPRRQPRPPNPVRPRRQPRPPNPARPRRQPRPPNPVRPRRQPRPPNLVRGPIERRRRRQHRRQHRRQPHHRRPARRRPCARPHRGRRAPCHGLPPRSLSAPWGPPNRRYLAGWSRSRSKATQRTQSPRHRQPPAEGHLPPSETDRQGGSCDPRRARPRCWCQDPGGVGSVSWTPPAPPARHASAERRTDGGRLTHDPRWSHQRPSPVVLPLAGHGRTGGRAPVGRCHRVVRRMASLVMRSARCRPDCRADRRRPDCRADPAPPARRPSRSPPARRRADPRAAGPTAEPIPARLSTFRSPGVEFGHVPK